MQIEPALRALGDASRLRIMRLLGEMELAVGEIAQVLSQSQPRVSQHVGKLVDAGLVERQREGSWVFLRAATGQSASPTGAAIGRLLAIAESEDPAFAEQCERDRELLSNIRASREENAATYFARHAEEWDTLRKLHSADQPVEEALDEALSDAPLGRMLDIGTGTGRMAELFAPKADHIVALDKSLEMLRIARAKLQHLPTDRIELVQGDFAALPFPAHSFDTVLLHQVLHFAQSPEVALKEAARVTRPGGRIAIIDLASHDREELRTRHAHVRLGFGDKAMASLLRGAGYSPVASPVALPGRELTVKIWTAERTPKLGDAAKEAIQ